MSSKFFENKNDKTSQTKGKRVGKGNSKGKGVNQSIRKVGRGK